MLIKKITLTLFLLLTILGVGIKYVSASNLISASDTMSREKTNFPSDHKILFVTPSGVASGQNITLTFSSGFSGIGNINSADVDLSEGDTNDCSTSVFTQKIMNDTPSSSEWSAIGSVQTITITSGGSLATILPNHCVEIDIGLNATDVSNSSAGPGIHQILNGPVWVESLNIAGTFGDVINIAELYIIDNDQVTISATVLPADSGGGGGGNIPVPTSVSFNGWAYPNSKVYLLEDGQEIANTVSDSSAKFQFSINNITAGTYTFSILSVDNNGNQSTIFTLPLLIAEGVATNVSGVFLAPSIFLNKLQVSQGDMIEISGQTVPNATVDIEIDTNPQINEQVVSDVNGNYFYNLSTLTIGYGSFGVKSKANFSTNSLHQSSYSKVLTFGVGAVNIINKKTCDLKADLNSDCKVNLVDFSIMAYWYHKPNPPSNIDLNGDGVVSLVDFSILAYYWTG